MLRKLFVATVLVNCIIFCSGNDSNSSVQTNCPDAVNRFNAALLRTTTRSLQVFSNLRNETGSISPMASTFLMATFSMFAQGQTRNELFTELDLRSTEEVMCVFTQFNQEVQNISSCMTFLAVPCIFGNSSYPLSSAFISNVDEIGLNGTGRNFDFSQSQETADAINQIIAQGTNNNIPMVINDYSIFNSSTELVPVSGVYLTGAWEIGFNKTTEVTQFRTSTSQSESQIFMYQEAEYNYAHSDTLGAKVVQVNTCSESMVVWILLPDTPFTEGAVIDKMAQNTDWYTELKSSMQPTRLDLYLPLFNQTTTADSRSILQQATPLRTIFDDQTINLKGAIKNDVRSAVTAGVQTTYMLSTFEGGPVPNGSSQGQRQRFRADYPHIFIIFRFDKPYIAGVFRRAVA